ATPPATSTSYISQAVGQATGEERFTPAGTRCGRVVRHRHRPTRTCDVGRVSGVERPPRGLLARLGAVVVRRRVVVLIATGVFVALAVPFGNNVVARLSTGGFTDPAAPSSRAEKLLADKFHTGVPNLVLLADAGGSVDDPVATADGEALTDRLAADPR